MFHKKIIVKIEGMKCEHCAKKVCDSLKKIDGIKSVKVDLDNKKATISYKNSINLEKVSSVIETVGYHYIGIES